MSDLIECGHFTCTVRHCPGFYFRIFVLITLCSLKPSYSAQRIRWSRYLRMSSDLLNLKKNCDFFLSRLSSDHSNRRCEFHGVFRNEMDLPELYSYRWHDVTATRSRLEMPCSSHFLCINNVLLMLSSDESVKWLATDWVTGVRFQAEAGMLKGECRQLM